PMKAGASLLPGHFRLEDGLARIEFYSGATVLLEGKADLELVSATQAILHAGKLRAQVPSHARGFAVRSRQIELADLGTEFGMAVDEKTGTQVHVFRRKVELADPGQAVSAGPKREIQAGSGLSVNAQFARREITADPGQFRSLQDLEQRSSARLRE